MISRKIRFSFFGNIAVPTVGAAVALIVVAPSASMAGTAASAPSVSARETGNLTGVMTDIGAARRLHYAHRGSVARSAFGRFIGGPVYRNPYGGGYPGFGYGVHDNSGPRSSG
jgi:hypothetical protein